MKYKLLHDATAYGTCGTYPYHVNMDEGEIIDGLISDGLNGDTIIVFKIEDSEYWLYASDAEAVWPEKRGTEAGELNRMQAMADYEAHDSVEPKSENVTKAEPAKDRIDAILEERGKAYGGEEDSFRRIASLWNGYLEAIEYHSLLPEDVARMMQLLKMARRLVLDKPTQDSFDDGHGYLKCEERLCR